MRRVCGSRLNEVLLTTVVTLNRPVVGQLHRDV